jgi:hypothetical protein
MSDTPIDPFSHGSRNVSSSTACSTLSAWAEISTAQAPLAAEPILRTSHHRCRGVGFPRSASCKASAGAPKLRSRSRATRFRSPRRLVAVEADAAAQVERSLRFGHDPRASQQRAGGGKRKYMPPIDPGEHHLPTIMPRGRLLALGGWPSWLDPSGRRRRHRSSPSLTVAVSLLGAGCGGPATLDVGSWP